MSTRILRPFRGALPATYAVSLTLIAGLVAFETFLALNSGGVGIPGVVLVHFADGHNRPDASLAAETPGGESVSAKLPPPPRPVPQPSSKTVATPIAPVTSTPRLSGLDDIPLKPWVEQGAKLDDTKSESKTGGREVLPWDAVEPVPFSPESPVAVSTNAMARIPSVAAPETPQVSATPIELPAVAMVESWIKASATEIKSAERSGALHHFEFWLEAPEQVKREIAAVTYEFNTPAVMPQSQVSKEAKTGFRIGAGGLTCADEVAVTLQFNNGQSQRVAVDGCALLRWGDWKLHALLVGTLRAADLIRFGEAYHKL